MADAKQSNSTSGSADTSANLNVQPSTPYTLSIQFRGDAAYTIAEYTPDGSGGWTKTKAIQDDGDSSDAQHDTYNMTPVLDGQTALVRVKANMEAVSSGSAVSMTALTKCAGKASDPVVSNGTYNGDDVPLSINIVVKGAAS